MRLAAMPTLIQLPPHRSNAAHATAAKRWELLVLPRKSAQATWAESTTKAAAAKLAAGKIRAK